MSVQVVFRLPNARFADSILTDIVVGNDQFAYSNHIDSNKIASLVLQLKEIRIKAIKVIDVVCSPLATIGGPEKSHLAEPLFNETLPMKFPYLLCFLLYCFLPAPLAFSQMESIVPLPSKITLKHKNQAVQTTSVLKKTWTQHLKIFSKHLKRVSGSEEQIRLSANPAATVIVAQDESLSPEAYRLVITDQEIQLYAASLKGLAHATATLLQLAADSSHDFLPAMTIEDQPRRSYRNLMIDMGRNPHSLELLKETIDLLWFYKIDSLQLHLTDDQRIAFPSTAFPKLWDGKITLQEFKDLETYAVLRGVTIIPELEVPGHSTLLRQRYPDVFGKEAADLTTEPALQGIKTLLDEMIEVFPSSPYIHIGGDEAFGVPDKNQRSLINQLHDYLKSKGRQTIVWEGPRPGEGDDKVNTEVIHINWETIYYAPDQMLQDGYRVVNASWDPLYVVDHYPRINFTMTSPQHIYETLSLTRFKTVNPGFPAYNSPIEVPMSDQLLGFCMPWWEGREENFFPQVVPRLIPFAEVAWNPETDRDYEAFSTRVTKSEAARMRAFYPVAIQATNLAVPEDGVFHRQTEVTFESRMQDSRNDSLQIHYTLDRSQPTIDSPTYVAPIELQKNTVIRATAYLSGEQIGHGSRLKLTRVDPIDNLALGKSVTSSVTSGPPFSAQRITDGDTDNLNFYLAYPAQPDPVVLTVDLGEVQQIGRVVVHSYSISGSYEQYTIEVSKDGRDFQQVAARLDKPDSPEMPGEHKFETRKARFIQIKSRGNKGYVFDSFSKIVELQVFQK